MANLNAITLAAEEITNMEKVYPFPGQAPSLINNLTLTLITLIKQEKKYILTAKRIQEMNAGRHIVLVRHSKQQKLTFAPMYIKKLKEEQIRTSMIQIKLSNTNCLPSVSISPHTCVQRPLLESASEMKVT